MIPPKNDAMLKFTEDEEPGVVVDGTIVVVMFTATSRPHTDTTYRRPLTKTVVTCEI